MDPAAGKREQKRRDKVFFGASVTVEDDAGTTTIYRIVGVDETDGLDAAVKEIRGLKNVKEALTVRL